jgi:hypothetical protein
MADTTILVPGQDSVTITVAEILTIDFVEDCRFCCNPERVNLFSPPLPLGDHLTGDTWSGVAQQSGTIRFHHEPYGEHCSPSAPQGAGRTIIVGSGGTE